jgi:hypothetical protein
MKVWLHRWPNGDTSLVWAGDLLQAAQLLDEVGSAPPKALIPIRAGAVHFHLNDAGKLELEQFDEALEQRIAKQLYPVLHAVIDQYPDEMGLDEVPAAELSTAAWTAAVAEERARLWNTDTLEPAQTPLGRALQRPFDMAGPLLDHYLKIHGEKAQAATAASTPGPGRSTETPRRKHPHRLHRQPETKASKG